MSSCSFAGLSSGEQVLCYTSGLASRGCEAGLGVYSGMMLGAAKHHTISSHYLQFGLDVYFCSRPRIGFMASVLSVAGVFLFSWFRFRYFRSL